MKNRQIGLFFLFLCVAGATLYFFHSLVPEEVEWIYYNGTIYSLDEENSKYEAMAVKNGTIRSIGTTEEILSRYRGAISIDLSGGTVIPGFIDSHAHLLSFGLSRLAVNLEGAESISEIGDRVASRVRSSMPGTWVRGSGWDQKMLSKDERAGLIALDKVSPDHPVVLIRRDGKALFVNSMAMKIVGIDPSTKDPSGGMIGRDTRGRPTGILIGSAMELVMRVLPEPGPAERIEAIRLAFNECVRHGVTTVHEMGVTRAEIDAYKQYFEEHSGPTVRVYAVVDGHSADWDYFRNQTPLIGFGNGQLTVRSVKFYVDGGLESRGAALIDSYTDDPGNRGVTVLGPDELSALTSDAVQRGYQVCVHAMGDRANTIALDAFQPVIESANRSDLRLRIEHAQTLLTDDIPRFARLGILPCIQPIHCISDMRWALTRLGHERMKRSYAWKSLKDAGSILPGGSDLPEDNPGPIAGIHAAITRRDAQGRPRTAREAARLFQMPEAAIADSAEFDGGWYASQRLERMDALRMFTAWSAYAGFEETSKGVLAPGMKADFVVLSDDIVKIDADSVLSLRVRTTVIGGVPVYRASRD